MTDRATAYIHARRRIHRYMTTGTTTIAARANPNTALPVHASSGLTGWKKFIPKNPVRKERGITNVVMMVSIFITSFIRLLTTDK